jgi:hypothetical protein
MWKVLPEEASVLREPRATSILLEATEVCRPSTPLRRTESRWRAFFERPQHPHEVRIQSREFLGRGRLDERDVRETCLDV